MGDLKFFLSLEVARSSKGIVLSQWHYALQLLSNVGYLGCKTKNTPMDLNVKLSQDDGDLLEDPLVYRRMIGKLLYLTITQPNLSYSVNSLSQFLAKPRVPHLQVAIAFWSTLKVVLVKVSSSLPLHLWNKRLSQMLIRQLVQTPEGL